MRGKITALRMVTRACRRGPITTKYKVVKTDGLIKKKIAIGRQRLSDEIVKGGRIRYNTPNRK